MAKRFVKFYLKEDLYQKVCSFAKENDLSIASVIIYALIFYFEFED